MHANTEAVNGYPAAACGYTSTPCGVCFLSIPEENFLGNYSFCIFHNLFSEQFKIDCRKILDVFGYNNSFIGKC